MLTAHDVGLRDLVESAALLRARPPILLVTISIDPEQTLGLELSPEVRTALPLVERVVRLLLERTREWDTIPPVSSSLELERPARA